MKILNNLQQHPICGGAEFGNIAVSSLAVLALGYGIYMTCQKSSTLEKEHSRQYNEAFQKGYDAGLAARLGQERL